MPKAAMQERFTAALTVTSLATLLLFGLAFVVASLAGRSIARQVAAEQARASAQILAANRDLEQRVQTAVAEARRAQEALLQNQKLEALGRLTGGIAHDFNNLLQTISTAMKWRAAPGEGSLALCGDGRRQARGASAVKLTRQLMTFGRAQAAARETLDLRDRRSRAAGAHRGARCAATSSCDFDIAASVWPVTADPVQLELALLNAALNARDAMPDGGAVDHRRAQRTAGRGRRRPACRPAITSRSRSTDSGAGIPADVLPRVFEPFFTTKDVGKGSGLGLAQVYGFASQSGGTATIQQRCSGRARRCASGCRARRPQAPSRRRRSPAHGAGASGAGQTVLFVEDDCWSASVVSRHSRSAGFRVIGALTSTQALREVTARGTKSTWCSRTS